jgi:tRNA threonylcarbamoyladenosine biosynthesis protein TsaE
LVHIYGEGDLTIWHFDLYRLNHRHEIYELGFEDALETAISLIEWPEKIIDILPKKRLDLNFEFVSLSETRIININGSNEWIEKV